MNQLVVSEPENSTLWFLLRYIRKEIRKKNVYPPEIDCYFAVTLCKGDIKVLDSIVAKTTVDLCDGIELFLQPCAVEAAWCSKCVNNTVLQATINVAIRTNLNGFLINDLISIILEYSQPVVKVAAEMFLDVQDTARSWTLAVIQKVFVFKDEIVLKIHYLLWNEIYDEFIFLSDQRVRFFYNYKNEVVFNWHCPVALDTNMEIRHRFSDSWSINNGRCCNVATTTSNMFNCAPPGTFFSLP